MRDVMRMYIFSNYESEVEREALSDSPIGRYREKLDASRSAQITDVLKVARDCGEVRSWFYYANLTIRLV